MSAQRQRSRASGFCVLIPHNKKWGTKLVSHKKGKEGKTCIWHSNSKEFIEPSVCTIISCLPKLHTPPALALLVFVSVKAREAPQLLGDPVYGRMVKAEAGAGKQGRHQGNNKNSRKGKTSLPSSKVLDPKHK